MIQILMPHMLSLTCNKFGSNVVEVRAHKENCLCVLTKRFACACSQRDSLVRAHKQTCLCL